MQLENVFYITDTTKQAHSAAAKFVSPKRKHKTRIRIAKPSKQERRDVQKSLLSDLPLYSRLVQQKKQKLRQVRLVMYMHTYNIIYIIHSTQVLRKGW